MQPPELATVWRGNVCEARVRGHVAVVDALGNVLASHGDPQTVTTLRSCVKPIQALPFLRIAAGALGATGAEIAIACASHNGEEDHVATVRSLLHRADVHEDALGCGAHLPFDPEAAARLLASGGRPMAIHNNCSGKHAAMLATCRVAGWPLDGYMEPAHPCQLAVTDALRPLLGIDLGSAASGIDGCGLPTYGVPLTALARSFAAAGADPGFRRCQDAMAAHPHLVAGTGRFDSALLVVAGVALTAKVGGAAVWAASIRPNGPGIALKLEAGAAEALPVIAIRLLQDLGALPERLPGELEPFASLAQHNWSGRLVGSIRANPVPLDKTA